MTLFNEKFEIEKQHEIEKLKKQNLILESLQMRGAQVDILTSEQSRKLDDILSLNKKYLKKLETNEFEIAIVGLEKAGKSTFANALIESAVLPSAPERCTFTSTRLVYGNDKAIVEFYNKAEFNKIFQNLLKEIEYPNADNENYETISEKSVEQYFSRLSDANSTIFQLHSGKTDEEIKDILKNRKKLILDGKIKEFSGDELLGDNFQSYIKGQKIGDDTDTSKPRSVKRIEIESSKLQQLNTAIIYDVPGFDSPTKIHERQTIERLKSADAIILVTNAGDRPNITAPQLDTIRKDNDSDGIPLKDKLFTFGNKIDTANSLDDAKSNERQLRNDIVNKYKIGEGKRLFVGSAKKYLSDKRLISGSDYKNNFEVDDGIDAIRAELIRYYENERFEILKRKIEKNRYEIKTMFKQILDSHDDFIDNNFAENERNRITRDAYKEIESTLKKSLEELKFNLKNEIWDEGYFSKKFKESVANLNYFCEISETDIKDAKLSEDESLTKDTPVEKMNNAIRKKVHIDFLHQFSKLINDMTDEKSRDVEIRLLRTFASAILGNNCTDLFDIVEEESDCFIKKITKNIAHNDGRFVYLIERFSRDIFDVLILHPISSNDRTDKFKNSELEFAYLDNYYSGGKNVLINIILSGEKKSNLNIDPLSLATNLLMLLTTPNTVVTRLPDIIKIAMDLKNSHQNQRRSIYHIDEIVKNENRCKTESDIIKEINNDIVNLRDILQTAIVPAVNFSVHDNFPNPRFSRSKLPFHLG